jgi:hypothetical protein
MPAFQSLVKTDPNDVDAPALGSGKMNFFIGLDNIARGRDELDVLHIFSPSVAASLQNIGGVVEIAAGAAPTAVGQVLAISALGTDTAEFQDARAALASTPYLTQRAPFTVAATIAIDEYLRVDLAGAAGDVPITLPQATVGLIDREVLIKINSLGFPSNGRKVVIVPDGADTVDGLAAGGGGHLEMVTNYEWRILRVAAAGVWEVVG